MMPSNRRKPELLSPAGDWDCLRAAVANGADAVYFGLDKFNARHRAENFQLDDLPKVVDYLHDHNVRAFVAFNILIFPEELDAAFDYLKQIADAGADAVIVQDLGLARIVKKAFPELELHASTQMTISDPRGAEFAKNLGACQVVLAREMSIEQISRVNESVEVPLEAFVHGALCVAYSGQCLTSEALGGRSANRGQCAQACRLPYEMLVDGRKVDLGDKAYLLSPQDLAGHELIPELLNAGVSCFKIEGRLKNASYVAATTRLYREAIDHAISGKPYHPDEQKLHDLSMAFSRGFTPGFLQGNNHQKLVRARFPKSRGVRIGTLRKVLSGMLVIDTAPSQTESDTPLKVGDGIVLDIAKPQEKEPGGRVSWLQKGKGHGIIEAKLHGGLDWPHDSLDGAIVWKTDDPEFLRRMESTFSRDEVINRQKLDFHLSGVAGGPLRLEATLEDGLKSTATSSENLEVSRERPFQEADAIKQLSRLGNTPFCMGKFRAEIPSNIFVGPSQLNQLRRHVVDDLLAKRKSASRKMIADNNALDHLRNEIAKDSCKDDSYHPRITLLVRNMEQLNAALDWNTSRNTKTLDIVHCDFEETRLYKDAVKLAREKNTAISLATLRILKPGEDGFLNQVLQCEPDAILVRNPSSLFHAQNVAPHIRLLGDWSLNAVNELSIDFLLKLGLESIAPGNDLNIDQLKLLAMKTDPSRLEVCAHLHMPMFHMEHCVFAAFLSKGKDHRDCGRPCEKHKVSLRDRTGAEFPVAVDAGCRNTVFNAVAQSAAQFLEKLSQLRIGRFRIELLRESGEETRNILNGYSGALSGTDSGTDLWRKLKASNQVGLTRGTLNLL